MTLLTSIKSVGLLGQLKSFKFDFQDGLRGGHFGFPNGTILTIFDLQVTPRLPTKFQVKWPFGSGEEVQTDSQDGGHLRFWIGTSLVIFDLQVAPILPTKLWELAQGWRRSCHLKQIVDNGHWLITIAHLEHFMLRWANKAVNNNQRVGACVSGKAQPSFFRLTS